MVCSTDSQCDRRHTRRTVKVRSRKDFSVFLTHATGLIAGDVLLVAEEVGECLEHVDGELGILLDSVATCALAEETRIYLKNCMILHLAFPLTVRPKNQGASGRAMRIVSGSSKPITSSENIDVCKS